VLRNKIVQKIKILYWNTSLFVE